MRRGVERLATAAAVLVGLSPLLCVTAREYGIQEGAYREAVERATLAASAQRHLGRGEREEAVAVLQEGIERYPDDPAFRHRLLRLLLRAGPPGGAPAEPREPEEGAGAEAGAVAVTRP